MITVHPFKVGTRVVHPQYGMGTVTRGGREYIGIDFDAHGESVLRLASSGLRLVHVEGVTDIPALRPATAEPLLTPPGWPECTFTFETSQEERHTMAARWAPFYPDPQEIVDRIPEIIDLAEPQTGYGEAFRPQRRQPADWAYGWTMAWPQCAHGVSAVIRQDCNDVEFVSMFPFHADGGQLGLRLDQVVVWDNGVEAQIEASIGDTPVCFYDCDFLINRLHYTAGRDYQFVILGMAYHAAIQQQQAVRISSNGEVAQWVPHTTAPAPGQWGVHQVNPDPDSEAMLMPNPDRDRDDYHFSGPVKRVEAVADILGQAGWLVDVTLVQAQAGDHEVDSDFRILITRRAWQEDSPPEVGMTISGVLWLQGRLWDTSPRVG